MGKMKNEVWIEGAALFILSIKQIFQCNDESIPTKKKINQ